MIVYNMRHRGPYEYDKFALNILQFSNLVSNIVNQIKDMTDENVLCYIKKLDDLIDSQINYQNEIAVLRERGKI